MLKRKNKIPIREIVLDTEVTGLDATTGDRIVEIACVELINHIPTGKVYEQYINPGFPMDNDIIAVHGITNEFLSDKPKFSDIMDDFLNFIGSDTLIAHNIKFDISFLNSELEGCHCLPLQNKTIDTLQIARQQFPNQRNHLNALCERFNVKASQFSDEKALLDAKLLAKVYRKMEYPTVWEKVISVVKKPLKNLHFSCFLKHN